MILVLLYAWCVFGRTPPPREWEVFPGPMPEDLTVDPPNEVVD